MNLAILTSGGDAPGMNAAIRAFVRRAIAEGHQVRGIERGFEGLVHGVQRPLAVASVANILMTGGTILHTSRFPVFRDPPMRSQALAHLDAWGVQGLLVLGGNGSLAGAYELSQLGVSVVAIPTSIDNDIPGTEYSLGFDTAVNNITGSMDKIRDTASAHERIFVVEVMGNHCGELAIAAGLAGGAEAIMIPEIATDYQAIVERLAQTHARGKKHSFIVAAEGAGSAQEIADHISDLTGHEVKWVVLGHTQRGGPPSAHDRIMAALWAEEALDALVSRHVGQMVGLYHGALTEVPLSDVVQGIHQPNLRWMTLAEMLAR